MRTLVVIEVDHRKELPHLAEMIAGRAWSIDGVTKAEVASTVSELSPQQLQAMGFTLEEISLGAGEVVR